MSRTGTTVGPRKLVQRLGGPIAPVFSICVMLTDWVEYDECMASFRAHGFDEDGCEFLVMDNSATNQADAYVALNEFLQAATGIYVVLCHQDLLLLDAGRVELEARLAELDRIAPNWGVCGNAGSMDDGWPAIGLAHPDETLVAGNLPQKVVSLDENFLVARRIANLALSRDLSGFHHYGSDICTVAAILGWEAYAIDFLLLHKSHGTFDDSWARSNAAIEAKYARALAPRRVHLVNGRSFLLGGTQVGRRLARVAQVIGKASGLVAKNRDHYNAAKRTRRDQRRAQRKL
jgi:hypothetical protein